ncbi:MAG: hypothetical protein ACFC03_00280 [Candidatus Malihini olakiniferum]
MDNRIEGFTTIIPGDLLNVIIEHYLANLLKKQLINEIGGVVPAERRAYLYQCRSGVNLLFGAYY